MKHIFAAVALVLVCVASSGQDLPAFEPTVTTHAAELDGAVGGVSVDALGYIYVADFGEKVWKVSPWGEVEILTEAMYGSSGNAIHPSGDLLQSNFHANSIVRVARDGSVSSFAEGLSGPVGIAIDSDETVYVTNCSSNSISRIRDGVMTELAAGDSFNCPNSIAIGADEHLYVLNFADGRMLRITPEGSTSLFATIPGGGNGHLVAVGEDFFVTALRAGRIFKVDSDGNLSSVAGSAPFGELDGAGSEASFSTPNGIGWDPLREILYTNTYPVPWTARFEGSVRPVSNLRAIRFPNLRERIDLAWEHGGESSTIAAVRNYSELRPAKVNEVILNLHGYRLLRQEGEPRKAVAVFLANTELFPTSFNTWDSLAEAYRAAGDRERAIENYRKSLELNPENANAVRMLEEMGVSSD